MNKTRSSIIAAAVTGLLMGSTTGCQSSAQPQVAEMGLEKHACKGMNDCSGKGGCKAGDNDCAGKNTCKGNGGCATVAHHNCGGKNDCKGMGGCKSGNNSCVAKNDCKGKGGCKVPVSCAAR